MNDYKPIACALHDELEAAAVTNRVCTFLVQETDCVYTLTDTITDIITERNAEYVILGGGGQIRLDRIAVFCGIPFSNVSC